MKQLHATGRPVGDQDWNPEHSSDFYDRSHASQKYYDRLAADFNELDEFWQNPYDTATWELENSLVGQFFQGPHALLDLGVGFYPHFDGAGQRRLICLDVSSRSLVVARRLVQPGETAAGYVCADALQMPFPKETFSGIIAGGELINHVCGHSLLMEIHRALRPGGRLLLSVGMKWCIDSLYAILDAYIGNHIGYSVTRSEANKFLRSPRQTASVTWEITPESRLQVFLYSRPDLMKIVAEIGFEISQIRALNVASGLIPLPIQQKSQAEGLLGLLTKALIGLDRQVLGRVPGIRWFGGNVYLVLTKPVRQ